MAKAEKASRQNTYHVQRKGGLRKHSGLQNSSALTVLEGKVGGKTRKKSSLDGARPVYRLRNLSIWHKGHWRI